MGIFEHFPYSNFHNLNLDKILERTQEAEEAVAASAAAAEAAAEDAATADANATLALNTANAANNTATNAKNTADAANSAINSLRTELTPTVVTSADLFDVDNSTVDITTVNAYKFGKLLIFAAIFESHGTPAKLILNADYAISGNSVIAEVYKLGDEDEVPPQFPTIQALAPGADFMTFNSSTRTFTIRETSNQQFYSIRCIALLSN